MNFSLILLTVERLVVIALQQKYSIATKNLKLFKNLLVISGGFSLLFPIYGATKTGRKQFISRWFIIAQTISIIFVLAITYPLIGLKKFCSRRQALRRSTSGRSNSRTLRISVFIVLTYITFYVVPSALIAWLLKKKLNVGNYAIAIGVSCVRSLGSVADMLIYVFFTSDSRTRIISTSCCFGYCGKRNKVMQDIELRSVRRISSGSQCAAYICQASGRCLKFDPQIIV